MRKQHYIGQSKPNLNKIYRKAWNTLKTKLSNLSKDTSVVNIQEPHYE